MTHAQALPTYATPSSLRTCQHTAITTLSTKDFWLDYPQNKTWNDSPTRSPPVPGDSFMDPTPLILPYFEAMTLLGELLPPFQIAIIIRLIRPKFCAPALPNPNPLEDDLGLSHHFTSLGEASFLLVDLSIKKICSNSIQFISNFPWAYVSTHYSAYNIWVFECINELMIDNVWSCH